ncbi:60S ribosomal protein l6 mitochondrial [Phtheirospermum japonicum]|uniref:60S ribosomal protein l6 mitochondrial n=1 Tax=Phtheirospermum japonicum TaxID=374723 RepID=A0A830C859_9LAMI|nr:60S ribosomal protein l6 mitochondrial [Phtheirospermum japonicum]
MEAKFFRFLKIVGVGFKARAESEVRLLYLKLGCSHEVELVVSPVIRVFCLKNNVGSRRRDPQSDDRRGELHRARERKGGGKVGTR